MSAMTWTHGRRVSSAARWAKSTAGFALVLGLVASVGHRYGMVETAAYLWLLAMVAVMAVVALLLAAIGFWWLWTYGDKAGKASLAAVILSCIVLAPFGLAGYLALEHPALTDVSTDLEEPPVFLMAEKSRQGEMNPIVPLTEERAEVQRAAYPELSGRRLEGSMERVMEAFNATVAAHGWTVTQRLDTTVAGLPELVVELDAPVTLVRFPADAVVRLTDEEESVFVDMRMSNRFVPHDLGESARQINAFLNELDAEFARQSLSIIDIPPSREDEDPVE
jgi:hypothetical protein